MTRIKASPPPPAAAIRVTLRAPGIGGGAAGVEETADAVGSRGKISGDAVVSVKCKND